MLSQTDLDSICSALKTTGYIILPKLLPDTLTAELQQHIQILAPQFQTAGIGRQQQHHVNQTIRSDRTQWLQGNDLAEQNYLSCMAQLQTALNRHLFLGLSDYECHFAHYTSGSYYQRHQDAFAGKSNRIVTTLLYLNKNWQADMGGELLIYPNESEENSFTAIERVLPYYGKMVIFMSDQFPHEVLASSQDRYSIAGWFRMDHALF